MPYWPGNLIYKWSFQLQIETAFSPPQLSEVDWCPLKEKMPTIVHKWHLCPVKLAKFVWRLSPNCWRRFAGEGTILHMWLQCPKAGSFGNEVIKIVSDTMHQKVHVGFIIAVIGLIHKDLITCNVGRLHYRFAHSGKIRNCW